MIFSEKKRLGVIVISVIVSPDVDDGNLNRCLCVFFAVK